MSVHRDDTSTKRGRTEVRHVSPRSTTPARGSVGTKESFGRPPKQERNGGEAQSQFHRWSPLSCGSVGHTCGVVQTSRHVPLRVGRPNRHCQRTHGSFCNFCCIIVGLLLPTDFCQLIRFANRGCLVAEADSSFELVNVKHHPRLSFSVALMRLSLEQGRAVNWHV